MSFPSWLRHLRSALAPGESHRGRRASHRAVTHRPRLEVLEDRIVPAFLAPVDYPVGASPTDVKAGDFNGEAIPDLATRTRASAPSACSWATPTARSSRLGPLSLANGHWQDRWPSATSTRTASSISQRGNYYAGYGGSGVDDVIVLLGNGDGTFVPPRLSRHEPGRGVRRRRRPERRRQSGPRRDVAGRLPATIMSACCSATATEPSRPPRRSTPTRLPPLAGAGRFRRRRQYSTWPAAARCSWATATARFRRPATSALTPITRDGRRLRRRRQTRPGRDQLQHA